MRQVTWMKCINWSIEGQKFSFFLMLFFLIPICLETRMILHLWLNVVPEYAVEFVRWTLIITTLAMLSNTLITSLHATGNIKRYMIIVGIIEFSNFPITYLVLRLEWDLFLLIMYILQFI